MASSPQEPLGAPRGRGGREWFLLAAASISSVALLLAAWVGVGDPELAGRAELARVASELESSVLHDWGQLRRGPWDWTAATPIRLGRPAQVPLDAPARASDNESADSLFDALLGEAQRRGSRADIPSRISLSQQAMDCGVGPMRMGRARVFRIGLQLEANDVERAREEWKQVRAELNGTEVEEAGGIALWLKAALSIEQALNPAERAALQAEIMQAWAAGSLALPPAFDLKALRADPEACLKQVLPLRAALQRRVAGLGDTTPAGFEQRLAQDRSSALGELLGHELVSDASGLARVESLGNWELVCQAQAGQSDDLRLWVLPAKTLAGKLEQVARTNGIVPADFRLVFGAATEQSEGTPIRAAIGLEGGPLELALYHSDPDSYVSSVQSKRWFLRAGLLLMALFTALAGAASFRAMRRERRLAGLKSAFVANVSHELRTPIASILLMAENLELGRVPDEAGQKRYTQLIRREAGRLRRLVDDVLDFSRLERGEGLRIARTATSFEALAGLLEEDLRSHVEAAGGELDFSSRGDDSALSIDVEALRRAALNLVDNSIKHSGTKRVEVSLNGGQNQCCLRVRDHGRGVKPARLASIMEPFERDEHLDAAAGTGLGLSIVREIARAHGGALSLQAPSQGAGLLVELRIPIGNES